MRSRDSGDPAPFGARRRPSGDENECVVPRVSQHSCGAFRTVKPSPRKRRCGVCQGEIEQAAEERSLKGKGKREKGEATLAGIREFSLVPYPFSLSRLASSRWQAAEMSRVFRSVTKTSGGAIRCPVSAVRYPLSAIRYPL